MSLFKPRKKGVHNTDTGPFWLPRNRRDDDVFLVSYPKSGNTWISFIIANMMVEKLGLDVCVNHFNIHGFVPDIHQGREIPLELGFFPFKRIIKSHVPFTNDYKNVIYVVRDPRSVMVSYHRYLTGLGQFRGTVTELIRDQRFGVHAWVDHIRGWRDGVRPGTRFRMFRYEDFKQDVGQATLQLGELLGATLTDAQLDRVTQRSSLQHMRELEERTGSLALRRQVDEFRFVREGAVTGWRNALSPEDVAYIQDSAGQWMANLGYE